MTAVSLVLFFLQLFSYCARSTAYEFTTTSTQTNYFVYRTDDPDNPLPTTTPFPADFTGAVEGAITIPTPIPTDFPTPVFNTTWYPTPYFAYANYYWLPSDFPSGAPYKTYGRDPFIDGHMLTHFIEPNIIYGPTTCTYQWTYTTWSSVGVYDSAAPMIMQDAIATSTYTESNRATPMTHVFGTLPTVTSGSDDWQYIQSFGCSTPGVHDISERTGTGSAITVGTERTEWFREQQRKKMGFWNQRGNIVWVSVVCVLAFVILCGFIENYWWFTRMMQGEEAARGMMICWAISLGCLGFLFMRMSRRRPIVEERRELRDRWRGYTVAQKFRLWRQWGFRRKYPEDLLGDEPGRVPPLGPFAHTAEERGRGRRETESPQVSRWYLGFKTPRVEARSVSGGSSLRTHPTRGRGSEEGMELPVYIPGSNPPPAEGPGGGARTETPPPVPPPPYEPPAGPTPPGPPVN